MNAAPLLLAAAATCLALACGQAAESAPLSSTHPESEDAAVAASPAPGTTIIPLVSLLCVEAEQDGSVVQTPCTDGDAQRFQLVPLATDGGVATYAIQTALGECLDFGSDPGDGSYVNAAPCLPASARQTFTVATNDDGSYGLASASGDGCFGPEDASALEGIRLITYTCAANAPSQRAYLAELGFRPRVGSKP